MKIYLLFLVLLMTLQLASAFDETIGVGDSVTVYVNRINTTYNYSIQRNLTVVIPQGINMNIDDDNNSLFQLSLAPSPTPTPIETLSQVVATPTPTPTPTKTQEEKDAVIFKWVMILFVVSIIIAIAMGIYFYRYFKEKKAMKKVPIDILQELEFAERRYNESGGKDPNGILWELSKIKRGRTGSFDKGEYGTENRNIEISDSERRGIQNDLAADSGWYSPSDSRYNTGNSRAKGNNHKSIFGRIFKRKQ